MIMLPSWRKNESDMKPAMKRRGFAFAGTRPTMTAFTRATKKAMKWSLMIPGLSRYTSVTIAGE
jgi:hypothetical protein